MGLVFFIGLTFCSISMGHIYSKPVGFLVFGGVLMLWAISTTILAYLKPEKYDPGP